MAEYLVLTQKVGGSTPSLPAILPFSHIGRSQQTPMLCSDKTVVVGSSPTRVERPDSSVGRARKQTNRPDYIERATNNLTFSEIYDIINIEKMR